MLSRKGWMTSGCVIAAMTFIRPPQCGHSNTSIEKTRAINAAHSIRLRGEARRRGGHDSVVSADPECVVLSGGTTVPSAVDSANAGGGKVGEDCGPLVPGGVGGVGGVGGDVGCSASGSCGERSGSGWASVGSLFASEADAGSWWQVVVGAGRGTRATTFGLSLEFGPNTPWYRVRFARGGGMMAARWAIRSSGSKTR